MIKETVTYKNYNGNSVTKDLYFHLSKLDLSEYVLNLEKPIDIMISEAAKNNDSKTIFKILKDLALLAYGERSENGEDFNKSKEIRDKFEHSEAFSEFIMGLVNDEHKMSTFFNSILPELSEEQRAEAQKRAAVLLNG